MTRFNVTAVLLAIGLAGCGNRGGMETRTFELRHVDPEVASELVAPYVFVDRENEPGSISVSREARAITVRESRDNLARIASILRERDRPQPGLVLHFQVVSASTADAPADPDIADLEAALRDIFRFRSYRLEGEAMVRAVAGSSIYQPIGTDDGYIIVGEMGSMFQTEEGGPARARLYVRFFRDQSNMALETTVNVVDGRTIVLGTAGGNDRNGAIILTVRTAVEE